MRPFSGVLFVEGLDALDGKKIAEGALVWRTPIPFFETVRVGPEPRRIIGHAYGVERVGDEIRVVGSIDLPVGEYGVAAAMQVEEGDELVTRARLVEAAVTTLPLVVPRCRISVGRDHIDAKVEGIVRAGVLEAYAPQLLQEG